MHDNAAIPTGPEVPQHSLLTSLGFHLLPGILTAAAFFILKPLLESTGYPPLLAFLLAVLLVDLPFMLRVLLTEGKKRNGRYSLDGVVLFRENLSWFKFALVFVAAFAVVYVLTLVTNPISDQLRHTLFAWLPDWTFLDEPTQYEAYPKNVLVVLFSLQVVLTGVVLPWVEELYFRGYLLPRLSRHGWWAPLLGGIFFALYHVWQLYSFPTVFLLGAALGYVVWWTRDIRTSASLHVVANLASRLVFLLAALAM